MFRKIVNTKCEVDEVLIQKEHANVNQLLFLNMVIETFHVMMASCREEETCRGTGAPYIDHVAQQVHILFNFQGQMDFDPEQNMIITKIIIKLNRESNTSDPRFIKRQQLRKMKYEEQCFVIKHKQTYSKYHN